MEWFTAWEFIESMLLAAQRQEGLRRSILEAADEAHPDAFTRLIDVAVEKNLIRFEALSNRGPALVHVHADVGLI